MDILGECVNVKTATREGPFNLQCKYLSISVERGEGGAGTEGGTIEESFNPFLFVVVV